MDTIYYTTKTGNLGASTDGGVTLVNHTGRTLPVSPVWEEIDASPADLTPACRAAVERAADVEEAEAVAIDEAQAAKAERIRLDGIEAERRRAFWASPEGLALRAKRQAAQDRNFARALRSVCRMLEG